MFEVMDKSTNNKLMAMVMCGLCYQGNCYLIYCVRRDKDEANVFISKLIKGSMGYVIDDNFSNGEKNAIEGVVNRLLDKESVDSLEKAGFSILRDIELDSYLSFDIEKCYVATVSRTLVKGCLIYYGLVNEKMFNQPVIEVVDDKRKFNEGFVSSIALIVVGVGILLLSCFVIYSVLFG